MNTDPIKPVVAKLLNRGDLSMLEPSELTLLREFIGLETPVARDTSEFPFWYWLRDGAQQLSYFMPGFELFMELEDEFDEILRQASGSNVMWPTMLARMVQPVSSQALRKAIHRILVNAEDSEQIVAATLLAGIAGFKDLSNDIVAVCNEAINRDEFWAEELTTASLSALALLDAPVEPSVIRLESIRDSDAGKAAAGFYLSRHVDDLSDELVGRLCGDNSFAEVLILVPGLVQRGVVPGQELVEILKRVVTRLEQNSYFASSIGLRFYLKFATLIVEAEDVGLLRWCLDKDQELLNSAILTELIRANATWSVAEIESSLGDENDDLLCGLRLAAIALLAEEPYALLVNWLDADRCTDALSGALWATTRDKNTKEFATKLSDHYDDDVRRYATLMLQLENGGVDEMLEVASELVFTGAFSDWTPLVLWTFLEREGKSLPGSLRDQLFQYGLVSNDEAFEFYKARPYRLCRILQNVPDLVDSSAYFRAIGIAGKLGGEVFRSVLEYLMIFCDDEDKGLMLGMELGCLGGPQSALGQAITKLAMNDNVVELESSELLPVSLMAIQSENWLSENAFASLAVSGGDEAIFKLGLPFRTFNNSSLKLNSLTMLRHVSDPLLRDIQKVGSLHSAEEFQYSVYDQLISLPSFELAEKLPAGSTKAKLSVDEQKSRLVFLAGNQAASVRCASIGELLLRHCDDWVVSLASEMLKDSDWDISASMASYIGRSGNIVFLPQLATALDEKWGSDLGDNFFQAMKSVIEANPEYGVHFWCVKEPGLVNEIFRDSVECEEFFMEEEEARSEGLRVLLEILQHRAVPSVANDQIGRTILIEKIGPDSLLAPSDQLLMLEELEQIVAYLSVTYVDDESGSIVTKVGSEPTGEILNALFQTGPVAVFTAKWT